MNIIYNKLDSILDRYPFTKDFVASSFSLFSVIITNKYNLNKINVILLTNDKNNYVGWTWYFREQYNINQYSSYRREFINYSCFIRKEYRKQKYGELLFRIFLNKVNRHKKAIYVYRHDITSSLFYDKIERENNIKLYNNLYTSIYDLNFR